MELLLSLCIGVLTGSGVYLLLRARTFSLLLGITLLSYGVNLFLFATGKLVLASAPITAPSLQTITTYPDPLPQALVLTAIVIGFGMTALLLVLALRTLAESHNDHVDQGQPVDHHVDTDRR